MPGKPKVEWLFIVQYSCEDQWVFGEKESVNPEIDSEATFFFPAN